MHSNLGNRLCYSDKVKRFVAVGSAGAIATADYDLSVQNSGSIKFINVSGDIEEHVITEETEYTIDTSKYTATDSDGNYYIDFEMQNIRLISAEVNNLVMDNITPKKVDSYNEAEIINYGENGSVLSWGIREKTESFTESLDLSTSYAPSYTSENYTETIDCSNGGISGEMISYQTLSEGDDDANTFRETLNCVNGGATGEMISYEEVEKTEEEVVAEEIDCSNGSKNGTAISYTQNTGTETISGDVMYFMDENVGGNKLHMTDPDHGVSSKEHMEFWLQSSKDGEMVRRFFSAYPATMTLTVKKAATLNEI